MEGNIPVVTIGDQMLAVVVDGSLCDGRRPGPYKRSCPLRTGPACSRRGGCHRPRTTFPAAAPSAIDARIDRTIRSWRQWSRLLAYDGPWKKAVTRSALALKTLFYEPGGAIAAAATTSLPERLGGPKNWDYRFTWVRDSSFTLDRFINLGMHEEVHASVSWMLSALRRSHPHLQVFYTLAGNVSGGETLLDLPGYRDSRPVRAGNNASTQTQLGTYGDLIDMVHRYVDAGHILDAGTRDLIVELADECSTKWPQKDSGIWELPKPEHYTISKIGCWVALDRAADLAERGQLPLRHARRWRREAKAIKRWAAGALLVKGPPFLHFLRRHRGSRRLRLAGWADPVRPRPAAGQHHRSSGGRAQPGTMRLSLFRHG